MPKFRADAALQLGLKHHQAGHLNEAEKSYRDILKRYPSHAPAIHFLGLAAQHRGKTEEAAAFMRRSIKLQGDVPDFHSNYAVVLQSLGALPEAEQAARNALALRPDYPQAENNLGNVLREQKKLAEAEQVFTALIARRPDLAEAHANLANVLIDLRRANEAVESLRAAIRLKPSFAEAHNALSLALLTLGILEEAELAARRSLELRPDSAEAMNNLGHALFRLGRLEESEVLLRRAVAVKPSFAGAYNNLGNTLVDRGQSAEAITVYQRAIMLQPVYAAAYNNLGVAYRVRGEFELALEQYQKAVELDKSSTEALANVGDMLVKGGAVTEGIAQLMEASRVDPHAVGPRSNLAGIYLDRGRLEESVALYRQAWALDPNRPESDSNYLLSLNYLAGISAEEVFAEHLAWAVRHTKGIVREAALGRRSPRSEGRLRIGYISPDFREHAAAFFVEPLLAAHDPARVEVVCYAQVPKPDDVTRRMQSHSHLWRDIYGSSNMALAAQIQQDQLDVLIDLAGHTAHNRLLMLASKPAPVQVEMIGYPNTTGLSAIDYIVTDPFLNPPGLTAHCFTERLLTLPKTFAVYRPPDDCPQIGALPALSNGYVTFGSINTLAKLNEGVLKCWADLLHRVPGSKLLCKAAPLREAPTRQRMLDTFDSLGIASDRVILAGPADLLSYMDSLNQIDIGLDPFPFNGHTTSMHLLWMGVPYITLAGRARAGRMGVSILNNAGLPDWIAQSLQQYISIAAAAAADLDRLRELRAGMRSRLEASPLRDAKGYASAVEDALVRIAGEY